MIAERLAIGKITKPHGVKGEVKIQPMTDDIKRFKKLKSVIIDDVEVKVESCKIQPDRAILKLEIINTPEEAVKYKEKILYIERKNAVALEEDEYFVADLIGCIVEDENGAELGSVIEVISTGSNDVYWVKSNKEEILIPALKNIVVSVNVKENKIVIKPVSEWME